MDEGYIVNRADGFEELFEKLDSMREGKDVAVIFEATRGSDSLRFNWGVLAASLPSQSWKTRKLNELDGSAKGKSDPRDAALLCDYLQLKADELLQQHVESDSLMLRLREAVHQERDLVHRVTKLKQRIYKQINNFCPELNHLLGDLGESGLPKVFAGA